MEQLRPLENHYFLSSQRDYFPYGAAGTVNLDVLFVPLSSQIAKT
jgi:hypothetical protein